MAKIAEINPIRNKTDKRSDDSKESPGVQEEEKQRRTKRSSILVTPGDIFNSSNADCGLNP